MLRSWKSVQSICSIHSSDFELSEVSSDEAIPSFEFEDLLPYVCKKFNSNFDVFVKKDVARDDSARYKKIDTPKLKIKRLPLVTPGFQTPIDQSSAKHGTAKQTNFIKLTGFFDTDNNLVEILVHKQRQVPRLLMQVVTVIAPIYENLYKITIRSCNIDAYVVYELNKLLAFMNVTDVCLDDSNLSEANYAILLEKESALKHLSLCRCLINDVVCKQISSKLRYLAPAEKHLLVLNLSGNHITDEGASYIGEMLRTNRRLRYLNLAGNRIGDDGARHILDTFMEFPLTYEEIADKRRRLLSYLKRKRELTKKFMNECEILTSNCGFHKPAEPGFKQNYVPSMSNLRQRPKNKVMASRLRMVENKEQAKEVAEMLALEVIGQIKDPLNFENIILKEGWSHCTGNLTLSYLNMAYNNLTHSSVKKILAVLLYQSCNSTGLFKVIIEGNCTQASCPEYGFISDLINKKMIAHIAKETAKSRKSHSRTSNMQKK